MLKQDFYKNLTIFDAVAKYAPAKDKNDVANYRKILTQVTKLDLKTKIKELTNEQFLLLCHAIQGVEGFIVGVISEEVPKKTILDIKKNKKNKIIQYLIEGYGWCRKLEAINLVERDIVDAVIVRKKNGYIFLRSRPDNTTFNNLKK